MVHQALTQEPNALTGAVARDHNALTERPISMKCPTCVKGELEYEKTESKERRTESGCESREG